MVSLPPNQIVCKWPIYPHKGGVYLGIEQHRIIMQCICSIEPGTTQHCTCSLHFLNRVFKKKKNI